MFYISYIALHPPLCCSRPPTVYTCYYVTHLKPLTPHPPQTYTHTHTTMTRLRGRYMYLGIQVWQQLLELCDLLLKPLAVVLRSTVLHLRLKLSCSEREREKNKKKESLCILNTKMYNLLILFSRISLDFLYSCKKKTKKHPRRCRVSSH